MSGYNAIGATVDGRVNRSKDWRSERITNCTAIGPRSLIVLFHKCDAPVTSLVGFAVLILSGLSPHLYYLLFIDVYL